MPVLEPSASATSGRKSRAWTQLGFSAITCAPDSSAAAITGGETAASMETRAISGCSAARSATARAENRHF